MFKKKQLGICGSCQFGKQQRGLHKAIQDRATSKVLQLLHMNLQDPTRKEPSSRVKKNHSFNLILGNLDEQMVTRKRYANMVRFICFVSLTERKNVNEALVEEFWVKAMQ